MNAGVSALNFYDSPGIAKDYPAILALLQPDKIIPTFSFAAAILERDVFCVYGSKLNGPAPTSLVSALSHTCAKNRAKSIKKSRLHQSFFFKQHHSRNQLRRTADAELLTGRRAMKLYGTFRDRQFGSNRFVG